jgi:hypothetical protein
MSVDHRPSDVEALAALKTLRTWLGLGESSGSIVYTQDRLPPDCESRDTYVRRHRELRKARVLGAWARGKTLACTPEAWATALPPRRRATKPEATPANDVELVAAAFGIRAK